MLAWQLAPPLLPTPQPQPPAGLGYCSIWGPPTPCPGELVSSTAYHLHIVLPKRKCNCTAEACRVYIVHIAGGREVTKTGPPPAARGSAERVAPSRKQTAGHLVLRVTAPGLGISGLASSLQPLPTLEA